TRKTPRSSHFHLVPSSSVTRPQMRPRSHPDSLLEGSRSRPPMITPIRKRPGSPLTQNPSRRKTTSRQDRCLEPKQMKRKMTSPQVFRSVPKPMKRKTINPRGFPSALKQMKRKPRRPRVSHLVPKHQRKRTTRPSRPNRARTC
ncbi:hypothetical protein OXX69_012913, partial [Metschnikowia pulcherrima]